MTWLLPLSKKLPTFGCRCRGSVLCSCPHWSSRSAPTASAAATHHPSYARCAIQEPALSLLCSVMDRRSLTPQAETVRVLVEFLEVAVSCIVFLKGFYPSGAFERRRYMGVVVHKARHLQLGNYIHSATHGLLPFLPKGLIERVAVIFYDKDHISLERFVFKLTVNQSYSSMIGEYDLEFALRAFLVKLTVTKALTNPLPPGGSWEITAYFRSLPDESGNPEEQLWVPTDTTQWMQPPSITPIKSMSSEPLKVQLYVEHPSPTEPKDQKR